MQRCVALNFQIFGAEMSEIFTLMIAYWLMRFSFLALRAGVARSKKGGTEMILLKIPRPDYGRRCAGSAEVALPRVRILAHRARVRAERRVDHLRIRLSSA